MSLRYLVEGDSSRETRVKRPLAHELVVGARLGIIGPMRPLKPLLAGPVVAQINHGRVASGPRADHHHAALLTHENARGDSGLAGMLEHDRWVPALAEDVPDGLPE